jgi:putative transposase
MFLIRGIVLSHEAVRHWEAKLTHRGIKDRYRPMRGFKSVTSAGRFCRAFDELLSFLRVRSFHRQDVSADRRRLRHLCRTITGLGILGVA